MSAISAFLRTRLSDTRLVTDQCRAMANVGIEWQIREESDDGAMQRLRSPAERAIGEAQSSLLSPISTHALRQFNDLLTLMDRQAAVGGCVATNRLH